MNGIIKRRVAFLVATVATIPLQMVAAQPTLSQAIPGAVMPGRAIELMLRGDKLTRPLTVWTSFPAEAALLADEGKTDEKLIRCRLNLSQDVPVGVGGVLIANQHGVSDTLLMLVDDLPSCKESSANRSVAEADELQLPVAVDGKSQAGVSDYFQFQADAGQRVTFEVYARRIASQMDPLIVLRDESGREIAFADDDLALGVDCRLQHTFEKAGRYIIELRDNEFKGNHRYRLRIGDFPLVATALPLGAQQGKSTVLQFTGQETGPLQKATVFLEPRPEVQGSTVGARYQGGRSSAIVRIASSDVPEVVHSESAEGSGQPLQVDLPVALNGLFDSAGDEDIYQFQATKGQRLLLKCQWRSLGSAAYVQVQIADSQGKVVAKTGVSGDDEQQLSHQIGADGVYRLIVQELLQRGGPQFAYRIEARVDTGFALSLKLTKGKKPVSRERFQIVAPTAGAFSIDIACSRLGFNGPIELEARAPNGPLRVYNNVIGEKQKETRLVVVLPAAQVGQGDFVPVQIIGRALVGQREVTQVASTRDMIQAKWPLLIHPPDWHDGLLCVAVGGQPEQLFSTKIESQTVYLPKCTGSGQFSLEVQRDKKGMNDPLIVALEDLPDEVSYSVKQEGKAPQEKYRVSVSASDDLPLGSYSFQVVSYGELNTQGYQHVIGNVPLRVVLPLTVDVQPAKVVAGQTTTVNVSISRFFGANLERHPVELHWHNLPEGVSVPEKVTVAAESYSAKVELTAARSAKAGSFKDVYVEATSKFEGQQIKVDSQPVRLEVVAP